MDHKKKEKVEITIETTQLTIVRSRRHPVLLWCDKCSAEVQMLTPEDAAALVQTVPREIYRKVENGELHFVESENGMLLCSNSLGKTEGGKSKSLSTIR